MEAYTTRALVGGQSTPRLADIGSKVFVSFLASQTARVFYLLNAHVILDDLSVLFFKCPLHFSIAMCNDLVLGLVERVDVIRRG